MWWVEWAAVALTMLAVAMYSRGNHRVGNPVQILACLGWIFMASEQGLQSVYFLNLVLFGFAIVGLIKERINREHTKSVERNYRKWKDGKDDRS